MLNLGNVVFGILVNTQGLTQAGAAVNNFSTTTLAAFTRISPAFSAFGAGITASVATMTGLVVATVNVARTLQAAETRLNAISGSVADSTMEMQRLHDMSTRLGVSYLGLIDSFSKWQAAVQGTSLEGSQAIDVFEKLTFVAAKLQLSQEELSGTFIALQQIMSKGIVQAEELRGQLGDRLYGSFVKAAQAMGVTQQELNKLLKTGQLASAVFVPKFVDEWIKALGDSNGTIDNLNASIQNLTNAWNDLLIVFGKTGIIQAVTYILKQTTAEINGLTEAYKRWKGIQDDATQSVKEYIAAQEKAPTAIRKNTEEAINIVQQQIDKQNELIATIRAQVADSSGAGQSYLEIGHAVAEMYNNYLYHGPAVNKIISDYADELLRAKAAAEEEGKAVAGDQLDKALAKRQELLDLQTKLNAILAKPERTLTADVTAQLTDRQIRSLREFEQELERVQNQTDAMAKGPDFFDRWSKMDDITQAVSRFHDRLVDAGFSEAQATAYTNKLADSLLNLKDVSEGNYAALKALADGYKDIYSNGFKQVSDSLAEMVVKWKFDAKSLVNIVQEMVQQIISKLLELSVMNRILNAILNPAVPFPTLSGSGLGGGGGAGLAPAARTGSGVPSIARTSVAASALAPSAGGGPGGPGGDVIHVDARTTIDARGANLRREDIQFMLDTRDKHLHDNLAGMIKERRRRAMI